MRGVVEKTSQGPQKKVSAAGAAPGNKLTRDYALKKSSDPSADEGSAVPWSEADLVHRALEGDRDAMRLLVERVQQPLYGYALAILGDHHEAQDVVQQALVAAYRGLPGFDLTRDFKRWVFGIARNLCFDSLRKRPRETPIGVGLDQFEDLDPRTGNQATSEAPSQKLDLLRVRIAQLPEDRRVILALRYLEGLSKAEIGKVLGLSYHAVGQRLYRSLRDLRRTMNVEPGD